MVSGGSDAVRGVGPAQWPLPMLAAHMSISGKGWWAWHRCDVFVCCGLRVYVAVVLPWLWRRWRVVAWDGRRHRKAVSVDQVCSMLPHGTFGSMWQRLANAGSIDLSVRRNERSDHEIAADAC